MNPNMQSDFALSIIVTAVGMGLVFAALGGLMLIISGLQRLFQAREASSSPVTPSPERPLPEVKAAGAGQDEAVAAIAVALAVLRQRQEALPPPKTTVVIFEPGTGAWQALGRLS